MEEQTQFHKEGLPEDILRELFYIAMARAADCLELSGGRVELKDPGCLKPTEAASIAAVERTASGCKVKFYDKLKALELLGQHYGLFRGVEAPAGEQSNLLEVLRITGKELALEDVSELQEELGECCS